MAKGAKAKEIIANSILNHFPGSFIYDKEIRIPFVEDGENIQLKCVLTCAKVNVEQGGENAIPGEQSDVAIGVDLGNDIDKTVNKTIPVSEEEKQNLKDLMNALGL